MITKLDAIRSLYDGPITIKADGSILYHGNGDEPTEEAIQAKLSKLQTDYDSKSYARARQQNFPNEHDLLIALWEKVMEDRSESADALQAIRTQVKSDNPKP